MDRRIPEPTARVYRETRGPSERRAEDLLARIERSIEVGELPASETPVRPARWVVAASLAAVVVLGVAVARLMGSGLGQRSVVEEAVAAPHTRAESQEPGHAVPRVAGPVARESRALEVAPGARIGPATAPEPTRPPVGVTEPTPRRAPSERGAAAPGIREELALMARAEQALAAGDTTASSDALREHARRFPRGQLVEDREAIGIRLQCARGEHGAARTEFEQFARRYPESPHLKKIRATCDFG